MLLGWLVHPALAGIAAFVGAGLLFAGVTETCGMGLLLAHMPWNHVQDGACCSADKAVNVYQTWSAEATTYLLLQPGGAAR